MFGGIERGVECEAASRVKTVAISVTEGNGEQCSRPAQRVQVYTLINGYILLFIIINVVLCFFFSNIVICTGKLF